MFSTAIWATMTHQALLETSSTSFVRDTGAMVYEIRGLRHRYSVTGRHGVKRRRDRNPRCPTETWWPTDRNSLYADRRLENFSSGLGLN